MIPGIQHICVRIRISTQTKGMANTELQEILQGYLLKARFALSTHYPDWEEGNQCQADADAKLVCIPPTLDLLKKYLGPTPEGPIENFAVKGYGTFKKRLMMTATNGNDAAKRSHFAGFDLDDLPPDFHPMLYKAAENEVRQFWAEQLTLERLRASIDTIKMGGYLILDVASEDIVSAILGISNDTTTDSEKSTTRQIKSTDDTPKKWTVEQKRAMMVEAAINTGSGEMVPIRRKSRMRSFSVPAGSKTADIVPVPSHQLLSKCIWRWNHIQDLFQFTQENYGPNKHFQLDQALFHPTHGLIVFEVKHFGSENERSKKKGKKTGGGDRLLTKRIKETVAQAKRMRRCLLHWIKLANITMAYEDIAFPITMVICCPNVSTEIEMDKNDNDGDGVYKMSKLDFATETNFQEKLKKVLESIPISKTGPRNLFKTSESFRNLFTFFATSRSAKLVSQAVNALELYRLLNSQEPARHLTYYGARSMPLTYPYVKMETIFLSPEQMSILESPVTCQTIWGAPGTGKTILVMLKLRQWCQEARIGHVYLCVPESLEFKYRMFMRMCEKSGVFFKRQLKIVVLDTSDYEKCYNFHAEDDVAVDEGVHDTLDSVIRSKPVAAAVTGRTFIAITGNMATQYIGAMREKSMAVANNNEPSASSSTTELCSVFRGTKSIVSFWKEGLDYEYGASVKLAHNVEGSRVETIEVVNRNQLMEVTQRWVKEILATWMTNSASSKEVSLLPCDLAVTTSENSFQDVKDALLDCGVKTQSVAEFAMEQTLDRDAVVIDGGSCVLSYEWPAVIVHTHRPIRSQIEIVNLSRATVLLRVIELNDVSPPTERS